MLSSLRPSCLVLILCALICSLASSILRAQRVPAQASASHFPTTEDLRHLKSIGGPQLSPDGKEALFTVMDATADGAKAHVWVVATNGSDKARQVTFSPPSDKRGEHNPQWAPDGAAIFFLAHRGENTQLFRLDLRGGEAAPYDLKIVPPVDESKEKNAIPPPGAEKKDDKKPEEKSDTQKKDATPETVLIDVSGYALSDDGKWLALWARDPQTSGEKKQSDAKADASWVNREKHGTRLYLAALQADGALDDSLKAVAIAPDVREAEWSPAADRLFVVTEPPNDLSDLGPAGAAWVVDAATPDNAAKLDAVPVTLGGGVFSTNGNQIVFSAATPEDAPPGYDELFALRVGEAGAKPLRLSAGFAGQLNASALFFTQDGSVITPAAVGTHATVVRIGLDGKRAPTPIDLGAPVISGITTNRKQTGWLWLAESGAQPQKLCFAQHLGDGCTALSLPEMAPANLRFVEPELVQWKSDGFTIDGLMYLPPDAGPTKKVPGAKVPLVVDVHGGPFGAFENRNDAFVAFLVGHGWAVLRPNPRGSSNYGAKFAAANKNDLGGGDYRDVMAGVDAALAKYPLDPSKMALMGYSYGGEMAAFVEGKTDRFKAIISGAPVIDQFSEYGTERGSWYDRWYFGKPWEHLDDAWRQSPLAGVAKAKTPFLLLQGQSDSTDPLGQAEEMYRALRQEGVPVELVTYPREDHGPLAIGMFGRPSPEPWHGYDGRQRLVEFLEKALETDTEKVQTAAQPSASR
jgi:dipeptidyl aminopeptidase/acylaminoacyl peptidase